MDSEWTDYISFDSTFNQLYIYIEFGKANRFANENSIFLVFIIDSFVLFWLFFRDGL